MTLSVNAYICSIELTEAQYLYYRSEHRREFEERVEKYRLSSTEFEFDKINEKYLVTFWADKLKHAKKLEKWLSKK